MAWIKNVLFGTIGGSQTWSTGWWLAESSADVSAPPTQAQMITYAEAAWSSAKTSAIKASAGIPTYSATNVQYLGLRSYWYRPSGSAVVKAQSSSAAVAGQSSNIHPNQVAVCCSILSDTLGKSTRGRMYLPCNGISQNADGTFNVAAPPVLATALANMLSAINLIDIGSKLFQAQVRSQLNPSSVAPVTGVRCDNVADTIRARRDKVVATQTSYTSVVVG